MMIQADRLTEKAAARRQEKARRGFHISCGKRTEKMNGCRIFIAGDSTAAEKMPDKRPETGWGEKLGGFFTENVTVVNRAVNGRSTRSFIDEGRLDRIAGEIGAGDFLLIQFGHNDEKEDPERHTDPDSTYSANLTRFVETARAVKATPVLLTPIQRRTFGPDGKIRESHGDYPAAMKALAARLDVALIDMTAVSRRYFESLGPEAVKSIFLWVEPGHPNYPDGLEDNTHFCESGARQIARLIAGGLRKLGLPSLNAVMNGAPE